AEKATQGSVARLKNPAEPDCAPAQMENCGWPAASVQDAPPFVDTTLVRPLEPPSFQRSCCTLPTRCMGLVGSTAMSGSTSSSGWLKRPSFSWLATSAAQVAEPPSGLSGTRTTEPADNVAASATVEPATTATMPIAPGASQRAKGSLMVDLMSYLLSCGTVTSDAGRDDGVLAQTVAGDRGPRAHLPGRSQQAGLLRGPVGWHRP